MVSGSAGILRLAETGPVEGVVSPALDENGSPYTVLFCPCILLSDSLETCTMMGQII